MKDLSRRCVSGLRPQCQEECCDVSKKQQHKNADDASRVRMAVRHTFLKWKAEARPVAFTSPSTVPHAH